MPVVVILIQATLDKVDEAAGMLLAASHGFLQFADAEKQAFSTTRILPTGVAPSRLIQLVPTGTTANQNPESEPTNSIFVPWPLTKSFTH